MKIKEKSKQFLDEKQILDIGKSSFATLIITMFFMLVLFVTNYNNLKGIVSILWFPLVTFCTLFSFSLGTIFFTKRD
jgi:ABC-type polysaccharide/polyol phosphate export permease